LGHFGSVSGSKVMIQSKQIN